MSNEKYEKLKEYSSKTLLSYISKETLDAVYRDTMVEEFLEELAYTIYGAEVYFPEGVEGKALINYDEDKVRKLLTKLLEEV